MLPGEFNLKLRPRNRQWIRHGHFAIEEKFFPRKPRRGRDARWTLGELDRFKF